LHLKVLDGRKGGVLLIKGIAGLVGVGDFTFGAAVDFDKLLDKNDKVWKTYS